VKPVGVLRISAVLGEAGNERSVRGIWMDEGVRLFGSRTMLTPESSMLWLTVLGRDA
jgi:hypothetical protein